jgi:DNA (cytosine-5)-methyltransferase 1
MRPTLPKITDRPKLLDLFCGAGGCAMGYHRAGFDIVGVDIKPQPRYPFPMVVADALQPPFNLRDFDVINASPPCQAYSRSRNNGTNKFAPRLIDETRRILHDSGKPFVIENVEGCPLHFPVIICGSMFGLGASGYDLPRHRLFECSHLLLAPPCSHRRGKTIGVYGNGTNSYHRNKMGRCLKESEKREAMGIDWMTRKELNQAIPPAYTEYIGKQLIRVIHEN